MNGQTETTSVEVFLVRSTGEGYSASRVSDPSNSEHHQRAVLERAREVALSSDGAIAMLTFHWRA